jgi:hypothetical protein
LEPRDREDERYRILAEALHEPCGHRCVYEVDLYDIKVAVKPVEGGARDFAIKLKGGKTRPAYTDNIATINRRLTFSRLNRCNDLYKIKYFSMAEGALEVQMSHRNEAMEQEASLHGREGNKVVFGFHPVPGKTYWLDLKVYGGFDAKNRNVHFHLIYDKKKIRYKKIRLRLDLTAYLEAHWSITVEPKLCFLHEEVEHDDYCKMRVRSELAEDPSARTEGAWTWELEDVRRGVLDVAWDVAAPVPPAPEDA